VDGKVMQEVSRLLGMRKTHTNAYHPQGNAITERENSVIKAMLTAFVNKRGNDWDEHLSAVMMAYRSSVHRTLNETPNAMMLGRQVRLPVDAFLPVPPESEYQTLPATEYAAALAESMIQAHTVVRQSIDTAMAYQKKSYDRNVMAESFTVGQAVWLRTYHLDRGQSSSLQNPWDWAWIVLKRISAVQYRIRKTPKGKCQIVYSDRLKPFHGEIEEPLTRELQKAVLQAQN
jgi:hypothetical protein